MRIPTQVTLKQGRWLDIFLLLGGLVAIAPIAVTLVFVGLTLATLWPLLILPIIMFQRAYPRGEEHTEEQFDRAIESVRPAHWVGRQARAH